MANTIASLLGRDDATQNFLDFRQIRDGVIILPNDSLRGVLMVSSINFALKPEEERDAIIYLFQDFLNSLDFWIEMFVQSRQLNITGYLDRLEEIQHEQTNELLRAQTESYREFIEQLVGEGTIMKKNFYAVVPFAPSEAGGKSLKLTEENFQRLKTQLQQRMEFVALGLKRIGLRAVPLTTPELIELLWSMHHPQEAEVGYYPDIPPELKRK